MADELLSDILAAEEEIRTEISALEEERSAWLAALEAGLEQELAQEELALDTECARTLTHAEQAAQKEAAEILADADAYRQRLSSLTEEELAPVIVRHLKHLCPEQGHDRQDEQT